MIKVENLHKSFEDEDVLKDISIEFERGITNLIIGRSGAGKTVLLKILVGLLKPDKGLVYYDDVNFLKLDKSQLRELRLKVGMLFQHGALFDSLTVEQNIRFPLDMFTKQTYKEKLKRVNYCLERVELEKINNVLPGEISGGMQKRVGIARSIVMDPKFLFCDEPNSGLDPKSSMVIDKLISDITKDNNITTIINTHDMNSVMEIGEKVTLLSEGRLAWVGNKDEILTSDQEEVQNFIFASPFLKKLRDMAVN